MKLTHMNNSFLTEIRGGNLRWGPITGLELNSLDGEGYRRPDFDEWDMCDLPEYYTTIGETLAFMSQVMMHLEFYAIPYTNPIRGGTTAESMIWAMNCACLNHLRRQESTNVD